MKAEFAVKVLKFSVLKEIEDAWRVSDYHALLEAMEYGDTSDLSDDDVREVCLMSLQDLDPDEAAKVVLTHRLSKQLNRGQIENVASEMADEKMWEEYADLALHEQMFYIGSLLYQAAPSRFPEPDAVRVELEVQAINKLAAEMLEQALHESLLVRLLADGMTETDILWRMFSEQLRGERFPEADKIVWIVTQTPRPEGGMNVTLISSGYWLDALRETKAYRSNAYPDST